MPYVEQLYYEEVGHGRPVIFIHCPALSHIYWRPVMRRLEDFCRCIAIDLRGHGRSAMADQPWTFAAMGQDVAMLTRRLTLERPVLVGYSAGGTIAIQAALDEPDLYAGVVPVGGFSECSTLHLSIKSRLGLLALHLGLTRFIGDAVVGTNSTGAEHTRAMVPDARQVNPAALTAYLKQVIDFDCTARLPALRLPVLLVYGEKDHPMLKYRRILEENLPAVRSLIIPNVDHRVPTKRTIEFADALAAFLASLPTP